MFFRVNVKEDDEVKVKVEEEDGVKVEKSMECKGRRRKKERVNLT